MRPNNVRAEFSTNRLRKLTGTRLTSLWVIGKATITTWLELKLRIVKSTVSFLVL